jgi:hypothetical protein
MIRSLCALVVIGAACNPPTCGKGTKQIQKTDGTVQCVPADGMISELDCDADGGATLVGGKCVSAVQCDPMTTMVKNGVCVGTGGGNMPHVPTACSAPSTGKFCINGVVRHLTDNTFLDGTEMVRVWIVDPLKFLANTAALQQNPCPTTVCLAPPMDTMDTYTFDDLPAPGAGLAVVAVGDAAGNLQLTGCGGRVSAGGKFQIDSYSTPKTLVAKWKTDTGIDYTGLGAYVARFYLDAAPDPHSITATESMPAMGVTLTQDSSPAAAKYFGADFMTIGSGTSTSAFGAALLPGSGDQQIFNFSGQDAMFGTKWEVHPGNTAPNAVLVDRYHPCVSMDANGKCLNM